MLTEQKLFWKGRYFCCIVHLFKNMYFLYFACHWHSSPPANRPSVILVLNVVFYFKTIGASIFIMNTNAILLKHQSFHMNNIIQNFTLTLIRYIISHMYICHRLGSPTNKSGVVCTCVLWTANWMNTPGILHSKD